MIKYGLSIKPYQYGGKLMRMVPVDYADTPCDLSSAVAHNDFLRNNLKQSKMDSLAHLLRQTR